ncbi:uncharacterized protein LOC124265904 [Haliotis rubra]|uniref:uncharacterized protein LOC124265904 n=1 Tax=Haliotis rubra TaxID=36100 RepID=UPI001EE50E80|nr:uncharacterized protein LOC124265904 [Haliotis rubra]
MSSPNNVLPVNYPGPPYNNLTRCYPAVHGNFTDVNSLVTALETSRYFGTDKFIFYNYSIPQQINKVLLQYEREGIVEMRNWRLPLPPEQIHYWGQMASIHDCVFSQLGVAKYVLLADIDEVVVPKSESTVHALADKLLTTPTLRPSTSYGALMFLNAFFFLNGHETTAEFLSKSDAVKCRLSVFLHTNRSSVNPPFYRSKLLVIPESVDVLQIHSAETLRPGWITLVVEPQYGLMHHYRKDYDPQALQPYTDDISLLQHSTSIIPRVKDRLRSFEKAKATGHLKECGGWD